MRTKYLDLQIVRQMSRRLSLYRPNVKCHSDFTVQAMAWHFPHILGARIIQISWNKANSLQIFSFSFKWMLVNKKQDLLKSKAVRKIILSKICKEMSILHTRTIFTPYNNFLTRVCGGPRRDAIFPLVSPYIVSFFFFVFSKIYIIKKETESFFTRK